MCCAVVAEPAKAPPVDETLALYIQALGGQAAIDRITTRELEIRGPHSKATLFWEAPDKVLRVAHEREGFDGTGAGWSETKKKKVKKLPKAVRDELETDANPIRYARLKAMYGDLEPGPSAIIDSKSMDVIIAPNNIGSTKFYFDATDHLLVRIEELGLTSAYYKHTIDFSDYRAVDGIQLPYTIHRSSEEPGLENGTVRVLKVKQNVPLNASIFSKPNIGAVVSGGKR